jgi:hypothetical protein
VLDAAGLPGAETAAWMASRDAARLVAGLAPRHALFAWKPAGPGNGPGAWHAASYIGAGAHWWRLGFYDRSLPGMRRQAEGPRGSSRAWAPNVWTWTPEGAPEGWSLTLSVREGMLLAAFSPDPDATLRMSQRLDRPPLLDGAPAECMQGAAAGGARDRFWVREDVGRPWLAGAFTRLGAPSLDGFLDVNAALPPAADPCPPASLLPTPPDAYVSGSLAGALGLLSQVPLPALTLSLAREVARGSDSESAVFAALLSGPLSGRVSFGVRIPAVLLGVRMRADFQMPQQLTNALDRINAVYNLGLIPRAGEGGVAYTIVDGAQQGSYNLLSASQKPAVAMWKEWLLLCSNAGTLRQLLEQADARRGAASASWLSAGGQRTHALLRVDSRRASRSLLDALAVWRLFLTVGQAGGRDVSRERSWIKEAETWAKRLAPAGVSIVRVESGEKGPRVAFRIMLPDAALSDEVLPPPEEL